MRHLLYHVSWSQSVHEYIVNSLQTTQQEYNRKNYEVPFYKVCAQMAEQLSPNQPNIKIKTTGGGG